MIEAMQYTTDDDLRLKGKVWLPKSTPSGVVCLIHGFGEHIDRYEHVAKSMNDAGLALCGIDLRGHGMSEGKRGHTPSFDHLMRDIDQYIKGTRTAYPGLPIHLYGHSMGGNLAYNMTRGLIKGMKKAKSGHVFNICSTASFMAYVNGGSYCISKFALLGMTKVLREEMKEYGVRVTAVMPGATYTASWEGAGLPKDRFMRSKDVASAIWNAYEMSDRTVIEEIIMRPQLGDI